MGRRKKLTSRKKESEKIDKEILALLSKRNIPSSTRDIALQINRAWHSVQTHCLRLQLENKLTGFRVGGLNLWQIKRK